MGPAGAGDCDVSYRKFASLQQIENFMWHTSPCHSTRWLVRHVQYVVNQSFPPLLMGPTKAKIHPRTLLNSLDWPVIPISAIATQASRCRYAVTLMFISLAVSRAGVT